MDTSGLYWNDDNANTLLTHIVNGSTLYYPEAIKFAQQFDSCSGHNSKTQYNYHKLSYCLTNALSPDSSGSYYTNMSDVHTLYTKKLNNLEHSPIIGWLLDGYPVYGPIGYKYTYENETVKLALDSSGNYITVFKQSSYIDEGINTSFSETVNNQLSYYHGYKYNNSLSIDQDGIYLDHCNGIFGPTPEFPYGIYHYHMTLKIDEYGNASKELDYFYPYDIDSMILTTNEVTTYASGKTSQTNLVDYINSKLDSDDVFKTLDDVLDIANTGKSIQVTITSGDLWSECLVKFYTRETTSGTYAYTANVTNANNTLYDNFDDWESDNNQGGLLNFWFKDTNDLGYSNLKEQFPDTFDQFETVVPSFPYITNILRGEVEKNSNTPMSNGNELSFLTSGSSGSSEWINAWSSLEESKKQF